MTRLLTILLLLFSINTFSNSKCVSIKSGNWNDASTWSCQNVPQCGDTIIISSNDTVNIVSQLEMVIN